ncbi:MAG: hypothetical protein V1717_03070 [Candidatus Micrarchaeota archaeon]
MKKRSKKRGGAIRIAVQVKTGKLEKRLHSFLDVWKQHVHDEIAIHKALLSGKQGLDQHLNETIRVHQKFIDKLKKI